MGGVRLGPPTDPETDQGPLISRAQQERVAGFVRRGRDDGAKVLIGGDAPAGALAAGCYFEPTLVVGAGQDSEIVREEIFGPVLVNDHIPIISEMPHGGYKASGFGKDMSTYSFEEYTQVKHVMFDRTGVAEKDWHRTIFGGSR